MRITDSGVATQDNKGTLPNIAFASDSVYVMISTVRICSMTPITSNFSKNFVFPTQFEATYLENTYHTVVM